MTRRRAYLLAIEGIDGAGKSTLAKGLARALRRRGRRVAVRREPADPELGRLAQKAGAREPWTSAVYFTLDRFLARPALERDLRRSDVVLTDRSLYSTLAYQGVALTPASLRRLEALGPAATVVPDHVVLLDLPSASAADRRTRRGGPRGPLEHRRRLARVSEQYRAMARKRHWTVLDGREPPDLLVQEVLRRLPRLAGSARRRART